MKSTIFVPVIIFLFTTLSHAETTGAPDTLPALIETALAVNPELKASQSRWQMFAGKARQAGALDDPMVMFKLQNLLVREPFSLGGKDPQTAKVIGISQQVPFWGKRALKEDIARYEAESYRWLIEERKLELARMIKESWYQMYAIDRALEIIDRNIKVMDDFVAIAESKYAVGQGVQQDLFKAGLEKSKMLDMQITLQQQRTSQTANLNYLLYRPENSPIPRIPDFALPDLKLSAQQLNESAYEKRPQIKSLINLANKGEAARQLAEKESWPDFNLAAEYMFRQEVANDMVRDPGYDMFTVGVTFNLPLQRERRQAMAAEASSESSMSMEELNALKNSIRYAISDTLARMESLKNLAALYKSGTIPQAEQSLESALINYRVNKVDFLTLLDSRITLYNYELGLSQAQAEYMMQLARLEAVVGASLVSTSLTP